MPIEPQPFDSVDMKPLPLETEPLRLVVGQDEYTLYLSDKHRDELENVLAKFTANEEPRAFSKTVTPVQSNRRKSDGESFKEWSKRMGHENDRQHFIDWGAANGHELAERGQVSQTFRDAYEAAQ